MDRVRRTINGFGAFASVWHTLVMVADPDNLVLVYLRRIDGKVDALAQRVEDLTLRMSAVESGLASVRRDLGHLAEADARLQSSFDKLRQDVDRIQRRLELTEEPAA